MSRFDTDNFDVDVIERSREKPVLVDFWAAWCGPCRVIGPVLERLADQNGDDWELRKLDTEKHPTIARQYRITSIPAVKLFVDGEVKDEFVGALPEQVIVDWLKKTLPSKFREQLKRAEALVDDRNFGEAHYLLSAVLENDPDDQDGIGLMAQVELYSDPSKAAETADRIPLGSDRFETAEAIKALSRLFQSMETPDVLDEAPIKTDYLERHPPAPSGQQRGRPRGIHRHNPPQPVLRRRRSAQGRHRRLQAPRRRPRDDQDLPQPLRQRPVLA